MQQIPLLAQPSQTLQTVVNGQQCEISVYSQRSYAYSDTPGFTVPSTNLYFDLVSNTVEITRTALCLDAKRLLINRQYLGFVGDFAFVDTQGDNDPQWQGLASRFALLYLTPADLAAIGVGP